MPMVSMFSILLDIAKPLGCGKNTGSCSQRKIPKQASPKAMALGQLHLRTRAIRVKKTTISPCSASVNNRTQFFSRHEIHLLDYPWIFCNTMKGWTYSDNPQTKDSPANQWDTHEQKQLLWFQDAGPGAKGCKTLIARIATPTFQTSGFQTSGSFDQTI